MKISVHLSLLGPWEKHILKRNNIYVIFKLEILRIRGEIVDPIYGIDPESEPPQMRVKISGDLPWDRYYGNYVYVKLKVNINIVTQQNIPVRVLHAVPIEKLKDDVINLNKPVIQDVVSNLMKYYI